MTVSSTNIAIEPTPKNSGHITSATQADRTAPCKTVALYTVDGISRTVRGGKGNLRRLDKQSTKGGLLLPRCFLPSGRESEQGQSSHRVPSDEVRPCCPKRSRIGDRSGVV